MKKPPVLILPIETKVRELHGKLLFAYMAAEAGFKVIIGSQVTIWDYIDLLPRGIYINKSVAATHAAWIARLKALGNQVVSWDEEGLLFFSSAMYNKLRLNRDALEGIEYFFCWGEVHKQTIIEWFPEYEGKLLVCGNPRADLMRHEYRDFYTPQVEKIKKQYGKILLINTNFAFCNHFRSEQALHSMLQSYPLASEKGYIEGWIQYQQEGFDTFHRIIPQLARRYPEYTIIIRPHPSENFRPWRELAENFPNLVVNGEGNVHEWIIAADALLHDNCTTAVEAFILGIPAVSYRLQQGNPQYINFLPKALSHEVNSPEALYAILDQNIQSHDHGKQKILEQYIAGLQGQSSISKILEVLQKQVSCTVPNPSLRVQGLNVLKTQWRIILHQYRAYKKPADGYVAQKFSGLETKEIEENFALFNSIQKKDLRFYIKKTAPAIYSIQLQA